MTLGLAAAMWLLTLGLFVATLVAAILAGRSKRFWRFPLLGLEVIGVGAAIVAWIFEVWFLAKLWISIGMSASVALIIGLVLGVALAVGAVLAGLRLTRAVYAAFGLGARFDSDFGNSLWVTRAGSWRPNEIRNP